MQKAFVLDTNVLIHDPDAIFSFADNKVILPMVVIEELDRLKNYRDNVGYNARLVARKLDTLRKKGHLYEGVEINKGGLLKVLLTDGKGEWPEALDRRDADNLIIKAAYDLIKTEKKVIFISKDLNARIKADVIGLEVKDYEKQKVKIGDFSSGWETVKVKPGIVDKFYAEKKLNIPDIQEEIKGTQFFPNSYILLSDAADENKTAITRYNKKMNQLEPLRFYQKSVWGIKALNLEQKFLFDLLLDPGVNVVSVIGQAGTGKTLIALAAGLKQTLDDGVYKKILVSRPIMPLGRDIGYLPGTKDEKLTVWMQPIFDNLYFILNQTGDIKLEGETIHAKRRGAGGISDYLIEAGMIELTAVTYMRGRSIPQQYIIIDEAQNLTPHEVKTIISRVGTNSKIVLTGDPYQIDNPYLDTESNGLIYVAERFKGQEIAGHIMLSKSERSPLASLAAELL